MKLHTYGLLRDSFRLASHREGVRTLWRLRGRHVEEAGREVQPMPKALTKMNIQWANAISDISGGSGQAIIGAILKGERDPYQLADLRHERVQASLPTRMPDVPHSTAEQTAAAPQKVPQAKKAKKPKGNAPGLDLQAYLKRICGVDLTTIEGIDVMTAMRVLSETGADMREFPTEDNFTGWLGLTPSPPISGGKVIGPERRKVQNRLAQALRMAASTLLNSKSYLGARYRHLRHPLPYKAAAVKARARYLAVLIYRMLTQGAVWVDRGAKQFEQKRSDREMAMRTSKALAQGFKLTPVTAA